MTEWLNLAVRWIHMITGIAWIGASFYFVWLENNLDRRSPGEGLSGELWAIHGGGIYRLEKYKLAPRRMPEHLHWFKWEAYSTWLSGVVLLTIVYYLRPGVYLVAPDGPLTPWGGVLVGIASMIGGWIVYDLLCDSPLGQRPAILGATIFALLVVAAFVLSQLFTGRAAYIHVGAIIGTIMVANVFRVIIPSQRSLVRAIQLHEEPDPRPPARALLRSRHNNYFTLPVLFIMISNHFPSTYGSRFNWAVLAAIAVLSVLVRHYFNTRHLTQRFAWTLPAAVLGLLCLAYLTGPAFTARALGGENVEFPQAEKVIRKHCTPCHSARPTNRLYAAPPLGVVMDTPQQIQQLAPRIHAQTVATQVMPLGNQTKMTREERELLGRWIAQGAKVR